MVIQGVAYLSDFEAKKAIIEAARRLEGRGFLPAGDGSLSVRVGPNAVWVTVDGADKAALTQDMLVRVDLNGKGNLSAHPKPLGEDLPIHLSIYRENENVQCVLHAYPPCAAALDGDLPAANYSPSVRKLGRLERLSGLSGEALAKAAALRSRSDSGALLEGDGCLFWAKTPVEVCRLAEALHYRWTVEDALRHTGCAGCEARSRREHTRPQADVSDANRPEGAALRPEMAERDNNRGGIAHATASAGLTGVTGLIRPGQSLPPLPGKQADPAVQTPLPAPVPSAPSPAADCPKADAMAEVVRRVLQNL